MSETPPDKSQLKIFFTCRACDKRWRIAAHHAGRKFRCPACKNIAVIIPEDGEAPSKQPAPAAHPDGQVAEPAPPPVAAPAVVTSRRRSRWVRKATRPKQLLAGLAYLALVGFAAPTLIDLPLWSLYILGYGKLFLAFADHPFIYPSIMCSWGFVPFALLLAVYAVVAHFLFPQRQLSVPWRHPTVIPLVILSVPNGMHMLAHVIDMLGYQEVGQSFSRAAWSVVHIYLWVIPHLALIYLVYGLTMHKIRRLRQIIYYTIWLSVPVLIWEPLLLTYLRDSLSARREAGLGFLLGAALSLIIILPWLGLARYLAQWLTPYILAYFVRSIKCSSCKDRYPVVSEWSCGCGYKDMRRRNLIVYRCPSCGAHFDKMDCPRCDCTILL